MQSLMKSLLLRRMNKSRKMRCLTDFLFPHFFPSPSLLHLWPLFVQNPDSSLNSVINANCCYGSIIPHRLQACQIMDAFQWPQLELFCIFAPLIIVFLLKWSSIYFTLFYQRFVLSKYMVAKYIVMLFRAL